MSQGCEDIQNMPLTISSPAIMSGMSGQRSKSMLVWTSSKAAPAQMQALMPSPVEPGIPELNEKVSLVSACRALIMSSWSA